VGVGGLWWGVILVSISKNKKVLSVFTFIH